MEMYCRTIELLWDAFPNVPVGLCKETVACARNWDSVNGILSVTARCR